MSIRYEFDDLVAARLRDTAPQEAPAHLMESLIARIADTPQRRRGTFGWLGSPVARLVLAAGVAAAAVIVGMQFGGLFERPVGTDGSPSPSPSAVASPDPRASGEPTPPSSVAASATPVAGDPSELVLRLETVCDTGPGPQAVPRFTLMADGTVVWHSFANELGIQARRLTPDGYAELTDTLFSGGLFETSATYEPVRRAGTPDPPGHGACFHTYTAADGAVVVGSTSWFGEPEESTHYEPAPERRALDSLATALADPESLVAEDAWTGPASAYENAEYQLVLHAVRDSPMPTGGSPDAADVPWPFEEPLDEFGDPSHDGAFRCGNISRDEALAIVDALYNPEGPHPAPDAAPYYFSIEWAEGNGWAEVFMIPLMPDGYPPCAAPLR